MEHAPRYPAVAPATAAFLRWFDVRDGNPLARDGAASWILVQLLPWLLICCVSLGCVRSLLHRCFLSRRWRVCWGEKCVCTKQWCCKGEQRQPIAPAGMQWPRWEVAVCTWFLRPLAAASAAALPLALFGFANPMAHSAGSTSSGADYGDTASIGTLGGGANASAALEGAAAAALADATGAISSPRLELTVRVMASGVAALALLSLLVASTALCCILCTCVRQSSPCRRVGYTKVALWVDTPKYVGFIDAWSPIFERAKGWGQGEPSNFGYLHHWLHVIAALASATLLGVASAECVLWRGDAPSPGAALLTRALALTPGSAWEHRVAYAAHGASHAAIYATCAILALIIVTILLEIVWLLCARPLLSQLEGAAMVSALALRAAFCGVTLAALILIEVGDALANGIGFLPWGPSATTEPAPLAGSVLVWIARGIVEPFAVALLVALLGFRLGKEGFAVHSSINEKYMAYRLRWIKIAPSGKSRWAWEQANEDWDVLDWLKEISKGVAIAWEQDGDDGEDGEGDGSQSPKDRASPKSTKSKLSKKPRVPKPTSPKSPLVGGDDDNKSVGSLGSLISKASRAVSKVSGFGSTAGSIQQKAQDFSDLYGARFLGEDMVTREVVCALTSDDLDYLDITESAHRVVFLKAIGELHAQWDADRRAALGDEASSDDFLYDEDDDGLTQATSTGWSVAAWLLSLGPWTEEGARKAAEKEAVKKLRRAEWTDAHALMMEERAERKSTEAKARQTRAYQQLPAGASHAFGSRLLLRMRACPGARCPPCFLRLTTPPLIFSLVSPSHVSYFSLLQAATRSFPSRSRQTTLTSRSPSSTPSTLGTGTTRRSVHTKPRLRRMATRIAKLSSRSRRKISTSSR